MNASEYSSQVLRTKLLERIQARPQYSLRAFARDLGVSHTYLSLVFNGKARLSMKQGMRFAAKLNLGPDFIAELSKGYLEKVPPIPAPNTESVLSFQLSTEMTRCRNESRWQHIALLALCSAKHFSADPKWIAKQLGITSREAGKALSRLEEQGLIRFDGKRYRPSAKYLRSLPDQPSESVREFHSQMIGKALEELLTLGPERFDRRDITGSTFLVDPERLAKAKNKIARFRRQMMDYLSGGNATELYQLNVQLFPLSRRKAK